jgi:hypothetical protein
MVIQGQVTQNPSFWKGVPHSVWAEVWWHEAFRRGVALDLPAPVGVHQGLIVQFAAGSISSLFYGRRKRPFIETLSKLAVWKMTRYQQTLQVLVASKSLDEDNIASFREDNSNVDYAGIDEPIQTVVKDMIQLSRALLMASCDGDIEESPALEDYIEGIRKHLQHTGLAGWVACRCAINVIQSVMIGRPSLTRRRRQPIKKGLLSLAKDIHPFYEETVPDRSGHSEDESRSPHFFLNRLRRLYTFHPYHIETLFPRYVRVERGTKPVALVDLLVESIHSGNSLPFVWMKSIPFSTEFIRLLVERCRDCLPDLLVFIGECSFVAIGAEAPVRVQDTQRILKIARNTDDPNVLAGVAAALMNASFLRIAESGLVQKILQAAPEVPLASVLFRVHKNWRGKGEQKSFDKEIKTVEQVARGVLNTPEKYAFKTVCLAADFIAEHQHVI